MAGGVSSAVATSMADTMVADWDWTALAIGDPGSDGTANPSSTTDRKATTWASASAGVVAANGTLPSWTSWSGTDGETVTDITGWDDDTAGNFQGFAPLSASVVMNTGDNLSLTGITGTVPVAT